MAGPSTFTPALPGFDIFPRASDSAAPHYLDVGDNVHANVHEAVASKVHIEGSWLFTNCADDEERWFNPGTCDNGHRVGKEIVCGKDWCPVCGKVGSMAHNRRYVRWLPKIRQFKSMRYIVFTIPAGLRGNYRSQDALRGMGRDVQAILQRHGMTRGLRRLHLFGDNSTRWHPHENCLTDGGYMESEEIDAITIEWARAIGVTETSPITRVKCTICEHERFLKKGEGKLSAGTMIPGKMRCGHSDTAVVFLKDMPKGVRVNCHYKKTSADMAGCLHYVTRATFHDWTWDKDMAEEIRGFRNMVVWGKMEYAKDADGKSIHECPEAWGGEPWAFKWDAKGKSRIDKVTGELMDVKAVEKLVNHTCHICGSTVHWDKPLPFRILELVSDKVSLGSGFYGLPDSPPSRHGPTPETLSMTVRRRCTEERRKQRQEWRYDLLARAFNGDKKAIDQLPADLRRQVHMAMLNDAQPVNEPWQPPPILPASLKTHVPRRGVTS